MEGCLVILENIPLVAFLETRSSSTFISQNCMYMTPFYSDHMDKLIYLNKQKSFHINKHSWHVYTGTSVCDETLIKYSKKMTIVFCGSIKHMDYFIYVNKY